MTKVTAHADASVPLGLGLPDAGVALDLRRAALPQRVQVVLGTGTRGRCHTPCPTPTAAVPAPTNAGGPEDSPVPLWMSPRPVPTLVAPFPPWDSIPVLQPASPPPCHCPQNAVPLSPSQRLHRYVPLSVPPTTLFCVSFIPRSLSPSLDRRPQAHSLLYPRVTSAADNTDVYVPSVSPCPWCHLAIVDVLQGRTNHVDTLVPTVSLCVPALAPPGHNKRPSRCS